MLLACMPMLCEAALAAAAISKLPLPCSTSCVRRGFVGPYCIGAINTATGSYDGRCGWALPRRSSTAIACASLAAALTCSCLRLPFPSPLLQLLLYGWVRHHRRLPGAPLAH